MLPLHQSPKWSICRLFGCLPGGCHARVSDYMAIVPPDTLGHDTHIPSLRIPLKVGCWDAWGLSGPYLPSG